MSPLPPEGGRALALPGIMMLLSVLSDFWTAWTGTDWREIIPDGSGDTGIPPGRFGRAAISGRAGATKYFAHACMTFSMNFAASSWPANRAAWTHDVKNDVHMNQSKVRMHFTVAYLPNCIHGKANLPGCFVSRGPSGLGQSHLQPPFQGLSPSSPYLRGASLPSPLRSLSCWQIGQQPAYESGQCDPGQCGQGCVSNESNCMVRRLIYSDNSIL